MMQVQILGTSGCMGCLGQDDGEVSSGDGSGSGGGALDQIKGLWDKYGSDIKSGAAAVSKATGVKIPGVGGTTTTAGAKATTTGGTDPYKKCAPLTSPLAKSQCMAQVNRSLNLRVAGAQQQAMGAMNAPPPSSSMGTIVTVLVVAGIGLAIWKLL